MPASPGFMTARSASPADAAGDLARLGSKGIPVDVVFEQGVSVLAGPLIMARWEPPEEQVVEARKPPRWPMVVLLLALLGVAGTGLWMFRRRCGRRPGRPCPRRKRSARR